MKRRGFLGALIGLFSVGQSRSELSSTRITSTPCDTILASYEVSESLLNCGDCYWWIGRDLIGRPKELWFVPPQNIRIIPNRKGRIIAYEIRNLFGDGRAVILPPSEIVHAYMPNVTWNGNGRFYGGPPISVKADNSKTA
jgi:hypothetical protein